MILMLDVDVELCDPGTPPLKMVNSLDILLVLLAFSVVDRLALEEASLREEADSLQAEVGFTPTGSP